MLERGLDVLAHQGNDDKDAQEAVNHAGNGGEKIDEEFEGVGEPRGGQLGEEIAAPMPSGTAMSSDTVAVTSVP